MVAEATLWCPSCGAEYRGDRPQCADCRVALVAEQPAFDRRRGRTTSGLVDLGEWPECRPKCCAAGSRPRASR